MEFEGWTYGSGILERPETMEAVDHSDPGGASELDNITSQKGWDLLIRGIQGVVGFGEFSDDCKH